MDWQNVKKELLDNNDMNKAYLELELEYQIIGQLIQARIDLGLTQAQLAELIGTRQSNISRLEHGDYNPTLAFLRKVARGLVSSNPLNCKSAARLGIIEPGCRSTVSGVA